MTRQPQLINDEIRNSQIKYWEEGARADLETSLAIFHDAKRYGASLFFLHLSIEKFLKALFVAKNNLYAPLTHNLLSLAEGCWLECDEAAKQTLATINEFNMVTRYPSQKSDFYRTATREFAELHLAKGKEIFRWIEEILQKSR